MVDTNTLGIIADLNKSLNTRVVDEFFVDDLVYWLCTECGWTQQDVESSDVLFVLRLLDAHQRALNSKKK